MRMLAAIIGWCGFSIITTILVWGVIFLNQFIILPTVPNIISTFALQANTFNSVLFTVLGNVIILGAFTLLFGLIIYHIYEFFIGLVEFAEE